LLLSLLAIFNYAKLPHKFKILFITLSFISSIFEISSELAIYYLGPEFASVKIISFFVFQITMFFILFFVILYLLKGPDDKNNGSRGKILHLIISIFAVFNLIFVILTSALFINRIGITPDEISRYYLGDPSIFMKAKTFEGIFNVTYIHLVPMAIYILTLTHLLLYISKSTPSKVLSILIFISAITDNLSGLLVRFVSPYFSYLKLLSVCILQISLFAASIIILLSLTQNRA
jgi:hypothetical protein